MPFKFSQVFTLLLASSLPAWPQASTATVSGTVKDSSGAIIPAARLTLKNADTNVAAATAVNGEGMYFFPAVIPGRYALSAQAPGFATFDTALTVQTQQRVVVDPVLSPGESKTTVTVTDSTPVITVDNPTLGRVLERQRIEQLPINGRQIQTLFQTVPGMEGERAYGMRLGTHEYTLDGSAMSDRSYLGRLLRPPGLDTIQEFKVETNNSSAKFTRPMTVVMTTKSGTNLFHGALFETHRNNGFGKARLRQDPGGKAPPLIRNEFGAAAGGPVVVPKVYNGKDRTFWFAAYEGLRQRQSTTRTGRVPTEAMWNGDFRGLVDSQGRRTTIYDPWTTNTQTWARQPFAYGGQTNVIDPARVAPLTKFLSGITPRPTLAQVNPLIEDNWIGPVGTPTTQNMFTARFDHRFSERDNFYARYNKATSSLEQTVQADHLPMINNPYNYLTRLSPNQSLALNWTRTFSPTFFNEVLVSGTRTIWTEATGTNDFNQYADQLGLPNPLGSWGRPNIYQTGFANTFWREMNARNTRFSYVIVDDNATKIVGRHQLEFGFHYRYDQLNELGVRQDRAGNHDFNTLATALYDPASSRSNPLQTPQTGHNMANLFIGSMNYSAQLAREWFYLRGREYALYLQDNWRVNSRLTLNLGLRWEHWPVLRDKNNLMAGFDPATKSVILGADLSEFVRLGATTQSVASRYQAHGGKFMSYEQAKLPRSLMNTSWKEFGPRVGFAWRAVDGDKPLVVRGGFRTSYFPVPIQAWTWRMYRNVPFSGRFLNSLTDASQAPDGIARYGMRSVPAIVAGRNSSNAIDTANASSLQRGGWIAAYFNPDQPQSGVHDWNLTFERPLPAGLVAKVSYVGNHGFNQDQNYSYNEAPSDYVWFAGTGERIPTGEFASVARRGFDKQLWGTIDEYRKTGWTNFNGMQFELERRYSRGVAFQLFYVTGNAFNIWGRGNSNAFDVTSWAPNMYLPGRVPADENERNRFLNYRRDTDIPQHRVRYNFIADLPFGRGKAIGRGAGGFLDRVIGGWQVAGMGNTRNNWFTLPTSVFPNGTPVEIYGTKYPIQDCRSGICRDGFLWWNGYIPANQINRKDAQGRPTGVMGVPDNYKPAAQPVLPWPQTPSTTDPNYALYGTNTVFVTLKDGSVQRTTYNDNLHPWRNQFAKGVWQFGFDASLFKSVAITERVKVRLNADFFNVFNNPGLPVAVDATGIVSSWTSGKSARELQLTVRVIW